MFDKITSRIDKLAYGLSADHVDPVLITQKVIGGVYPGVTTVELDSLAAETAASFTTRHPDYSVLAARIVVSNLHKQTKKLFSDVMEDMYVMLPSPPVSATFLLAFFFLRSLDRFLCIVH